MKNELVLIRKLPLGMSIELAETRLAMSAFVFLCQVVCANMSV